MTLQNPITRLHRRVRRIWHENFSPLRPAKLFPADILVHFSYHKCLTKYYAAVVHTLAREFGFGWVNCEKNYGRFLHAATALRGKRVVLLDEWSNIAWDKLPPYRGTHFVRDPRDLVVSGYHYHLRTHEAWCRDEPYTWQAIVAHPLFPYVETNPAKFPRAETYQAYLNSLDKERGLIVELLWRDGKFKHMARWNYHNPNILEMKYEDIVGNEAAAFEKILAFYQMHPRLIARGVELAEAHSLKHQTAARNHHIRKGTHGQWREEFTPLVKQLFKQEWSALLIQLGYEENADW